MSVPTDPLIGRTLDGRYRVMSVLGEGGMGTVYQAEETTLGKHVAVKVLHRHLARDEDSVTRFFREAKVVSTLGHRNIVQVTDVGKLPDGGAYMVLELLEGEDWSVVLDRSGPQPIASVVQVLSQVCSGLQAAHDAGVVHRDMKPANIFLVQQPSGGSHVKILDFGISKMETDEDLTATRATLGTVAFMSPEQVRAAKDVDHRSDIYTLGVIAFIALTGHKPFEDDSLAMLATKILKDTPPRVSDFRADIPAGLEKLIRRTLDKNPDKRPQSCRELQGALARYDDIVSTAHMRPIPVQRKPMSMTLLSSIVVAALIVIGGVMWWATSEPVPVSEPLEPIAGPAPELEVEGEADGETPEAETPEAETPEPETPEAETPEAELEVEAEPEDEPETMVRPRMRPRMRPTRMSMSSMMGRSGTDISVDDF